MKRLAEAIIEAQKIFEDSRDKFYRPTKSIGKAAIEAAKNANFDIQKTQLIYLILTNNLKDANMWAIETIDS